MDKLLDSAKNWKSLLDYRIEIAYGFKNKIEIINISFDAEDYYHLAGFHYSKDVSLPKFSKDKYIQKVLDEKIKLDMIKKSDNYDGFISPRLNALCSVTGILNGNFRLYKYNPIFYSFHSNIVADYILFDAITNTPYFLFVRQNDYGSEEIEYKAISIFEQSDRNYIENQKVLNILYIKSYNLVDKTEEYIYKNTNYKE